MEECRFETSELQASFMTATPLWYDSWSLCEVADRTRSIQIHRIAGIMYVALPAVEITQPDNLVVLEVAGDGYFSAFSTSLPSNEPPPMVNGAIRDLFVSSALHIQSQVCFLFFTSLLLLFVWNYHWIVRSISILRIYYCPNKLKFDLMRQKCKFN